MDLDSLPRKCYACNVCKKFKISIGSQMKCELCGHHKYMHEQVIFAFIKDIYSII